MPAAKPITIETIDEGDYRGPAPQPFAVIGPIPGTEGGPIAIADVTGLEGRLAAIESRLDALEV